VRYALSLNWCIRYYLSQY